MKPCIVMIGDSINGPGGISSVVRTYRDVGFLRERNISYLSNYDGAGLLMQTTVMVRAILAFLRLRFSQGVALAHIHSASRGSFWRAALHGELAHITGVPYVLHIHSGEFVVFFNEACGRFAKALVRRVLRRASGVICLTPGWKTQLQLIAPQAVPVSYTHLTLPTSDLV